MTRLVARASTDRFVGPTRALVAVALAAVLLGGVPTEVRSEEQTVHTYGNTEGHEVSNLVAVSQDKLIPLLPAGYQILPAAGLGVGSWDQGIVAIANFRAVDPTVDGQSYGQRGQVAIDVGILVIEPVDSVRAGVSIPGAFHLYALAIYTDDARYAASLQQSGLPVKFFEHITYERNIDEPSGAGTLQVRVPGNGSTLMTSSSSQGYIPMTGAFNAVFWTDRGERGKAVLHFRDEPFRQGNAIGHVYTDPNSMLGKLLTGGGFGSCAPDPSTGFGCVIAPSVNLRYDAGTRGKLVILDRAKD